MKITPLDIRQQQFTVRFRGFDAEEVDTFLEMIADEYEEIIEENHRLKQELEKKKEEKKILLENEDKLKKMLQSKGVKEDIAGTAGKEAQLIIKDAEMKAKEILDKYQSEIKGLKKEVEELQRQRNELKIKIRSAIEPYLKLLKTEDKKDK